MTTTYFFNDPSIWGADGMPLPLSDFSFPENKIVKIEKNVLSELGYNNVIIPQSSKVIFVDDDIHFITKTINLYGEVELNKRSFITCDSLNQSNLIVIPFHLATSWGNNVIPGIGDDINIPPNSAILITSTTPLESYYGALNIPQGSQLIIDSSVIDAQLLVTSFNVNGSISSAQHNSVKLYRGDPSLFLPVLLDSDGNVIDENADNKKVDVSLTLDLDFNNAGEANSTERETFEESLKTELSTLLGISSNRIVINNISSGSVVLDFTILPAPNDSEPLAENAAALLEEKVQDTNSDLYTSESITIMSQVDATQPVDTLVVEAAVVPATVMDSSYNFIMHSSQTSADSFSKFIKLKLDDNNTPSFIFNQAYKTQLNNQLLADISGTKLVHFDEKFFNDQRNTKDDTLGNMLIQYISSIIFNDPSVSNAISNSTDIINNVLNSNLHEQFTNTISNDLDETTFNTNSIINAMYQQLKITDSTRFSDLVSNTTYDFPVKSGDQIAIFVKMKANLIFSKNHSTGNSEHVYRILKSDDKLSNNPLIEFNDTDFSIKILSSTWKIVISLS